jgi:TolB-like protein/Flp pilus assembly protein TadD
MPAPRLRLFNIANASAPVPDDGGKQSSRATAYEFGQFRLVTAEKQLLRAGKPVPLRPKLYETLLILVQNQGHLVEKDVLLEHLWPDCFVDEATLAQSISKLRKTLENPPCENRYIETVPKRGYRFLAAVTVIGTETSLEPAQVTLAVLPFEDFGADPAREYLADGLTEEVIAALGRIDPEYLRVIGRTSMMTYKRTTRSLAEIGRELGAEYLVESSMRAEGARIRIISKLIRVRDQVQLWSTSYDNEPVSMLEFQRALSMTLADEIRLRLSPTRLDALARRQTRQVEAYDLYLRGRYIWNRLSPLTTRRAIEYYARATELDPEYALAWCGLADAYTVSPINGDADPLQAWPRASQAAERALRSRPDLAEAWNSLGTMKFWLGWDWAGSEAALHKAIALDPVNALAHRDLAVVLSRTGRHERARAAARRARELEPLHAPHLAISAQLEFDARDYAAAVALASQATILDPEFWVGYFQLAQAQAQAGNSDLALEALNRCGRFSSNSKLIALRGCVFASLGKTEEAKTTLKTLEAASREHYVPPYATALVLANMGNGNEAFEWLDRAYQARDVHLVFLTTDPKWDMFRAEPRFRALLTRCGFTQQKSQE